MADPIFDHLEETIRGTATPAEMRGWGRALDDMRDRIAAARQTGLSDYQIRRILDKESQVSQETINALLRGGYPKIAK